MKECPQCGFQDSPIWKPLFWKIYWEYAPFNDFLIGYPKLEPIANFFLGKPNQKLYCEEGDFWYHFEDYLHYFKVAGKTRKMIHRFPKGYETMANKKLFEKTPSEKGEDDIFQKKLLP